MPKLALVTVLFKSENVLPGFFKTLKIQTLTGYTIYFVDNSVSDSSTAILRQLMLNNPLLHCIHMVQPGNIGVAAGNNAGIRAALDDGCTHILLLNNDIESDQEFLLQYILEKSEQGKADIIVPKILYFHSRNIWLGGGYMDNSRALGVHEGMGKPDNGSYDREKYIGYAPTCFMLITKKVFETTGIMDEKYFAYYDDTDFVVRALKDGFKMLYMPALTVLHKVSSSSGGDLSSFYIYYSNRNKLYFIWKHYRGLKKIWLITYTLISRVAFYLRFGSQQKKSLINGLKDGFELIRPGRKHHQA